MASTDIELVKKGHSKDQYTEKELQELMRSSVDPLYFMKTFMKVQHPTKGALQFVPYPYQEELIKTFHANRFSIALIGRQQGKCLSFSTFIKQNNNLRQIGDVISNQLTWRQKLVNLLEQAIIRLAR